MDELVAWYRRLCDVDDAPELRNVDDAEARFDQLRPDQLLAAAQRFDADFVVITKPRMPARLALPVAFEDNDHVVYRAH
jgi:hypothetical protein